MVRSALLPLLLLVLLGTPSPAETLQKSVKAKGRLVVLEVPAPSDGDVLWDPRSPSTMEWHSCETHEGKSVFVFVLTVPKALVTSDVIDYGNRKTTRTFWTVEAPGPLPPDPDNPDVPDVPDQYGLANLAKTALQKVRPEGLAHRQALRGNFQSISSAVAAGALQSVEAARKGLQEANQRLLGAQGTQQWHPWLMDVGKAVDALEDSGKIKTVQQYGQVLAEIAEGLK